MVKLKPKAIPPGKPRNKLRRFCYVVVMSLWFEMLIMAMICLNTLALCMDYYGAGKTYLFCLGVANNVFVGIFTLEAVLKLIGLGPRYYFIEAWNIFDCLIVVLSLLSSDPSIFGNVNVTPLRIIRTARLVKMIKTSKGLKSLLKTLFSSLGNIANVAMLMILMFFTFTCAGMALFGELEFDGNITK